MASQEPSDMMILFSIVEYLKIRANSQDESVVIDPAVVTNIVNFGTLLRGDIQANREVIMGDRYDVSGQAAAVGRDAHATEVTLNQIQWTGGQLSALASELESLRAAMRQRASTPDEDLATAEVGQAMIAAKAGDSNRTQSHLRRAGKWAIDVATTIGTTVAAEAIKSSVGL